MPSTLNRLRFSQAFKDFLSTRNGLIPHFELFETKTSHIP